MKKLVSLTLALMLALSILVLPAMAEERRTVGVLSVLNVSEEEMASIRSARRRLASQLEREGLAVGVNENSRGKKPNLEVVYFDTLDAMRMALDAGDIDYMELYSSTAQYLIHNDPGLVLRYTFKDETKGNTFAELAFNSLLCNDFAFMFMEKNAALRDEFNAALASITEEEKDQLIREHITAAINGEEISPVQMPVIDGAETIKVAVTGVLPPMDYVAADGTPAGYNTALLAEISKRIGKNIELLVVDSLGRAAALASGTVDAVFWTRTNSESNHAASLTEEERDETRKAFDAEMTEEEIKAMHRTQEEIDFAKYGRVDMPEGTIITEPYYSDIIVTVTTVANMEERKARTND